MKTLKSIIMGLMLLTASAAVKASGKPAERATQNYVINTYVDAMSRGKIAGFSEVLDQTVKFDMLRGKKVLSFDKKQMLEYMQLNKNVEQNCTLNTAIIENTDAFALVKVDMNYDGAVRSNYVSLANTGNGWKITNVYSVFK